MERSGAKETERRAERVRSAFALSLERSAAPLREGRAPLRSALSFFSERRSAPLRSVKWDRAERSAERRFSERPAPLCEPSLLRSAPLRSMTDPSLRSVPRGQSGAKRVRSVKWDRAERSEERGLDPLRSASLRKSTLCPSLRSAPLRSVSTCGAKVGRAAQVYFTEPAPVRSAL